MHRRWKDHQASILWLATDFPYMKFFSFAKWSFFSFISSQEPLYLALLYYSFRSHNLHEFGRLYLQCFLCNPQNTVKLLEDQFHCPTSNHRIRLLYIHQSLHVWLNQKVSTYHSRLCARYH